MKRLQQIRDEAIAQEAYWRGRRVSYVRLGLEEARDAGMTLVEAADYLGANRGAVWQACQRYGIKLRVGRRGRPRGWVSHPGAKIEILNTVRETAIANRGKASASQIAAALGVSRNSIIGHWFRSRQSETV